MARDAYSFVDMGRGALLVRGRVGGGFNKVAQCRSADAARRLAEELNGLNSIHVGDIREAIQLLETATNDGVTRATKLLRLMTGE